MSFNLRRASRVIGRLYDEVLQPCGLKATQVALLAASSSLAEREGTPTLTRVASVLGMDLSTLSRNVTVLEKQGLIERGQEGGDRRNRSVIVSDAGLKRLAAAWPLWEQAQARVFEALGGEDNSRRLLKELRKAARAALDGPASF